jgi:glycopeptide antibiotics resistance protein
MVVVYPIVTVKGITIALAQHTNLEKTLENHLFNINTISFSVTAACIALSLKKHLI